MTKLIQLLDYSYQIENRRLFQGESFTLNSQDRVAIQGPSGTGKTLFLRSICLLEKRLTGTLLWKEAPLLPTAIPVYRSEVIYLGQRTTFSHGTVRSAFHEVFQLKVHRDKKWDEALTLECLKLFNRPAQFLDQRLDQLSGGEKQWVQMLRALAVKPRVLCLDEPTSALDPWSTQQFEVCLQKYYEGAWLWVTHQKDQAERVGINDKLSLPIQSFS